MRRQLKKQLPALLGLGSVLIASMAGMGYLGLQAVGQASADVLGCYADVPQRQTFVFVDVSGPRFNDEQRRSLQSYFDQLYAGLAFNERLSVYTNEADQIASVASPRFTLCAPARSPADLEAVNAPTASAGYLSKERERLYTKLLGPELRVLLADDVPASRTQNYQSPILEMIADLSRVPTMRPGSRLIVISDLLQNSDTARFCIVKGDMPHFSVFARRHDFQRVKPKSLAGVDVEVLMLQRYGYGQAGLEYCRDEEELRKFWLDYFIGAGVKDPRFIRIRNGVTGG